MVSKARIQTNHCLMKAFNLEDFLKPDSLSHDELSYYNHLTRSFDQHISKYIDWLDSDEARKIFYEQNEIKEEYFQAIDDELDEIIQDTSLSANRIIERVYRKGLNYGYREINRLPVFNDACKYGLKATQDYNFELITNVSNDLKNTIKHYIFRGIAEGQSVQEVAKELVDAGLKPLENKTLTAYQRASLIARTEIARSMTTGRLQSYANYGVEKVKILTAGDEHVCPICLEAEGEVYDILKVSVLVPFHPACRCSVMAVIEHLLDESVDYNMIDLTSANSSFWSHYKAPSDAKPFVLNENELEKLGSFMSEKDLDNLKLLLEIMNKTCYNCEYEYMIGNTNKRFPMEKAYTSWQRDNVFLPEELKDLDDDEYISILIHNHAWGMNILPSDKDIKLLINSNVEYGVITNNSGLVVIKNNNPTSNKLEAPNIEDIIDHCEDKLIEDLKIYHGIDFNFSDNHKKILNEYLKDNYDKYFKFYCNELQEKFDIEIMFINIK